MPGRSIALLMAAAMACSTSFAEKPEWAGGGKNKGNKHEQAEQSDHGDAGQGGKKGEEKQACRRGQSRRLFCAAAARRGPELLRQTVQGRPLPSGPGQEKNNGCLPPGQAKKYAIGQPLPRDVVFYPVPSAVVVQLGAPPAGHKYVRVATDILLIAVGTSMVVDAIQDFRLALSQVLAPGARSRSSELLLGGCWQRRTSDRKRAYVKGVFCLLSRKSTKSKQRKGDPGCCVPPLRCGQPAVLGSGGVSLNSPSAQTTRSLIRLTPALLGASSKGAGRNYKHQRTNLKTNKDSPWRVLVCLGIVLFLLFGFRSRLPRPGWAEERRDKRIRDGVV